MTRLGPVLWLAVLLALPAWADPVGPRIPEIDPKSLPVVFGDIPEDVAAAVKASRNLPLAERIGQISHTLLGRKYLENAIGEGAGPDHDPPARYDVFDCVTFIEEVLALALAPDLGSAGTYRHLLRYGDRPATVENRYHFFEAEWIPNNVANGFLRDITEELGHAEQLHKDVTLSSWQHWRRRSRFPFSDARFPTGPLEMPVLGIDEALRVVNQIPPGAIIVTVRKPLNSMPIVVSHVGITVPAAVPTMRHATHMASRNVRDDKLAWYVEYLKEYTVRPVAGVRILLPLEQGPRRILPAR